MSETLEERVANILSANTLIWVQGNTECRWLTDEERDALLSLACRPDPAAELSRLRAEVEAWKEREQILDRMTRNQADAIINLRDELSAAEQALALAREAHKELLYEIANRASNLLDRDASDWLPSIYKLACEGACEDPSRLLDAYERQTGRKITLSPQPSEPKGTA